jgi:hypothetical protein
MFFGTPVVPLVCAKRTGGPEVRQRLAALFLGLDGRPQVFVGADRHLAEQTPRTCATCPEPMGAARKAVPACRAENIPQAPPAEPAPGNGSGQ